MLGSLFIKGYDAAPGITAARIAQVRPGMSAAQVLSLLGRPYHVYSYKGNNTHYFNCPNSDEGSVDVEVSCSLDVAALVRWATADTAVHHCYRGEAWAHSRETIFRYTRPVKWAGNYPMLWVHLDAAARVSNIYVAHYTPCLLFGEHSPVYARRADARQNIGDSGALLQLFER